MSIVVAPIIASMLLAQAPPPPGPAAPPAAPTEVKKRKRAPKSTKRLFDFSKADIGDIVEAIADLTQRNYIISETLKSKKITIRSETPVTANEAYQAFLSALAINDITVVRVGKFYKLVPSKDAIKSTIPTCINPGDDCPRFSEQMITQIIQLKYVDANQINPIIKNLTSKGAEISIFQPTNAIIVSEYASNLTRVKRIIEALDQPGFEDELQIVQIEHATATEIADKLNQIFEDKGKPAARGRAATRPKRDKSAKGAKDSGTENDVQISNIIPDDRTNQLIIKASRRSFEAIRRLIAKLDVPITDPDAAGSVHVMYLENADAEELAGVLSSLASGQPTQARRPARAQTNANRPNQNQNARGSADTALLFEGEVKVTADRATNALIIIATGDDYLNMKRLVEKLDKPRRQVYVEAAIMEVTVTNDENFGINWHSPVRFPQRDFGRELGSSIGFVQSAQADGGISPTLAALQDPASLLAAAGGSLVGVVGGGVTVPVGDSELTIPAFGVVLNWLEQASTANILSTPHILTSDNEEATIEVGQKIPFQRGTSIPNIPGAGGVAGQLGQLGSLFSSTDRIDVSLKLTITPHVNERGKVRLEIDQQLEDIAGEGVGGQPITATRNAKTVVVVDDQQTVVIGGLMRDRVTEGHGKIPILGDIPIIGMLFRNTSTKIEKVNLLLVLTPYVVETNDDFQRIFERKMNEYEEFAASYYGHTARYRAHINYTRKTGPFAKLASAVMNHMDKIENGGDGEGDVLVGPADENDEPSDDKPSEDETITLPPGANGPPDAGTDGPVIEPYSPSPRSTPAPAGGDDD